jgi:hypothetical protein
MKDAQFYTLTLFDYDRDRKSEYLGLDQPGLDHSAPPGVEPGRQPVARLMKNWGPTYVRSGEKGR